MLRLELKTLVSAVLLLVWTVVAHAVGYVHAPGGPFYFKTFVTNFEEPLTPAEEMTDAEAQAHIQKGASVYTVWFNAQGLISKIEKHHQGVRLMLIEYKYKDGILSERRSIDEHDKETIKRY